MQNNPDYDNIQTRMKVLNGYFDEFKTLQIQLEVQQLDDDDHNEARNEIEAHYCQSIARAQALIRKLAESIDVRAESGNESETHSP